MSDNEQMVQQIEIALEQAQKRVDMMDALARLWQHPDFRTVILEGYFVNEASRCVLLKGDINMQDPDKQADMDRQIIAIGGLRSHFNAIFQMGQMSKQAMEDDKNTREELLAEDLEGEEDL